MLTGAMLGLMEQIGQDIQTLAGELDEREFFASRITRIQTLRLLASMAKNAGYIPDGIKQQMPEIDWHSWQTLAAALVQPELHRLQIWVAIKELIPLSLQHLSDYRRTHPELFSIVS